MLRRAGLLLLLLGCTSAASLVMRPAPHVRAVPHTSGAVARAPLSTVGMQVAEPPVKIPDKVPDLAPAQPKGDRKSEKGKKYKLLLFNDNVNRSAAPSVAALSGARAPVPSRAASQHRHAHLVLSAARASCRREYVAKVLMSSVPDLKQADAYVIMQKAHKCGGARQTGWPLERDRAHTAAEKVGGRGWRACERLTTPPCRCCAGVAWRSSVCGSSSWPRRIATCFVPGD